MTPPCSTLASTPVVPAHWQSALLGRIPLRMLSAWHFYYGLYSWSLRYASLTRHWREVHLHPSCSPLCAAMGCLTFIR